MIVMILHVMYGVQSHSFIIENKLYYFSVFGYCIFFIRGFGLRILVFGIPHSQGI